MSLEIPLRHSIENIVAKTHFPVVAVGLDVGRYRPKQDQTEAEEKTGDNPGDDFSIRSSRAPQKRESKTVKIFFDNPATFRNM